MDLTDLAAPTRADEIEWRIQAAGKKADGDIWCRLVPYVTNRAIMNRLDKVVGPANWQNHFRESHGGVMCGISIFIAGTTDAEWVTKWDGAPETNIEPFKGGLSDAMKRAGVQWGIGRDLYSMGETWADDTTTTRPPNNVRHLWRRAAPGSKHPEFWWKLPEGGSGASATDPEPEPLPPVAIRKLFVAACVEAGMDIGFAVDEAQLYVAAKVGEAKNLKLTPDDLTGEQWQAAINHLPEIVKAMTPKKEQT